MTDDRAVKMAKSTYDVMCGKLDEMGWKYEKYEEDFVIKSGVRGDDLPIEFIIVVNPDTQIVRYMSKMPFNIGEEKRIDAAIAVCAANNGLVDGNFDYDVLTGEIVYRMTANFRESLLGGDVFEYMVIVSSKIVDKYNDRFLMLSKGMLSIEQFLAMDME
jgi:hypothetical protein